MIIEDLIRLGKPLLQGDLSAREILELATDATDEKVKNFFRHVFVVELPSKSSDASPFVLPMQVWGQEVAKSNAEKDFTSDAKRALGAPFVLPTGGNSLNPQGRYGVPVYPCWDRHLRDFCESPEAVRHFLDGRLDRTPGFELEESARTKLAKVIHERVVQSDLSDQGKVLGVVILTQCVGEVAHYAYQELPSDFDLGRSRLQPGKFIVPCFERILEAVWAGRLEEGASMGTREGACSICGRGEQVVSSYCKAWPWALPTWNCPLPQGGDEKMMAESIALDESCHQALSLGACVFDKLTRPVHQFVTRELFSPVADREGRDSASRRKLPAIRGTAYLLPLHDEALEDPFRCKEFAFNIISMVRPPEKAGSYMDRYLDTVTGFDVFLPDDAEIADYRLTLVYFSGDPSRGDIHLRALVEGVIPSTLRKLKGIAQASGETAVALLKALSPSASVRQVANYRTLHRSVPYMLARAYGGAYLWDLLGTTVHRRPLDTLRPMFNAARRMNSLAARYPETRFDLNDEVVFYLTFLDFMAGYHGQLVADSDDPCGASKAWERRPVMTMRLWKEMLRAVAEAPVEELRYDSPAELGFGCGVLMRQFGRWYWNATKVGKEGKDFLKHRVLTFGSDLSPDVVWKRGLAKVFDVAARYDKIHISEDFRQRVGVTLAEFDRLHEEVRKNRDAFMSAFWSGHALQGCDRSQTDESGSAVSSPSDEPNRFVETERSDQ